MKQFLRNFVCEQLERRVEKLRNEHDFTVVAIAGSVGKTSTKMAVARTLESADKKVIYQEGNYNDRVSVPLVFFGETMPSLTNVLAWFGVFRRMTKQISRPYDYDVVVVELGTDGPGQMKDFAYIQPDITVLSAISPEHMAQFGMIDEVAKEELVVAEYSKKLLVNVADIDQKYLETIDFTGYGVDAASAYSITRIGDNGIVGQKVKITTPNGEIEVETEYGGKQGATIILAAVTVADILGVPLGEVANAVAKLQPFSGRMRMLKGVKNSQIIDDTYNSSPLAARAALDVLYGATATQKIAILGDMNELGETSTREHEELGAYCRADELDYVVTIGEKSREYLSPMAEKAGCRVKSFMNPVEAGEFVRSIVKSGAIILAKGSQNGVFAEEAVKLLLEDSSDTSKLVRQSKGWMEKKRFEK